MAEEKKTALEWAQMAPRSGTVRPQSVRGYRLPRGFYGALRRAGKKQDDTMTAKEFAQMMDDHLSAPCCGSAGKVGGPGPTELSAVETPTADRDQKKQGHGKVFGIGGEHDE